MAVRCVACVGKKSLMGLGGMVKKCEACNGIGYVADVVDIKPEEVKKSRVKPKPKAKAKLKSKVKPKESESCKENMQADDPQSIPQN